MSGVWPLVSVVVPARNEATDIEACITGIVGQTYPSDSLEVIVVDGCSGDDTVRIATARLEASALSTWRVLTNPRGSTPSSLNVGLRACRGDYVCRVDARSIIPPDYIERCVGHLRERGDITVVGGAQRAAARRADVVPVGIAQALNNPLGTGLARYRRGRASGPTDTVYLGFFRRADLEAVGGWDERFETNQDFELNRRLGRQGLVWFDADLEVTYVPRSNLRDLWRQYVRFGRWKVRYWRITGDPPRLRQWVSLVAPAVAGLGLLAVVVRRPRLFLAVGAPVAGVIVAGAGTRAGRQRLAATAASLVVGLGWNVGVWSELIGGRR